MVKNSFTKGPEGWCSYDYHASMVAGGRNIFVLATWSADGGVDNAGYIWADQNRWSADTPEKPLSILPLLFYPSWINQDPAKLLQAEVSVYLRGDDLRLDGAQCLFWAHVGGTRWHYSSQPLEITQGHWADQPNRFTLKNDESLWHMSWSNTPDNPAPLDAVLQGAHSYGFSFVGFSSEVTGRFCMAEFEIS
jgi:hypothetical protein